MTGTRLRAYLASPVDGASVAAFRVVFGLLLLVATVRFVAMGSIAEYYEQPRHFFSYYGLSWVKPWPAPGMYWLEAKLSSKEGVSAPATERRASYSATLEVLAP